MLTAKGSDGRICYAPEVEKTAAPFICPSCESAVILKKGNKYIHHFAHAPKSPCDLRGESVEHMTAKWEIYQALKRHPQIGRVETEFTLWPNVRADVMFRKGEQVVAVEIQRSRLDTETVLRRMMHYTAQRIGVLWLIFPLKVKHEWVNDKDCIDYVSTQRWQRYIQRIYFGRLYEWSHGWGLETYGTHLTGNWRRRTSGIRPGPLMNIVDDFEVTTRRPWEDLPCLCIYKDRKKTWWKE